MAIFNCRFILDLREAAERAENNTELTVALTTQEATRMSPVVFRRPDRNANAITSSVYGATVLWALDEPPMTPLMDDTQEDLQEGIEMT